MVSCLHVFRVRQDIMTKGFGGAMFTSWQHESTEIGLGPRYNFQGHDLLLPVRAYLFKFLTPPQRVQQAGEKAFNVSDYWRYFIFKAEHFNPGFQKQKVYLSLCWLVLC